MKMQHLISSQHKSNECVHVRVFVLLLNILFNSYGHVGMVSSPNHTFFLDKLEQAVNKYSVDILLFVTDNNPS